MEKKTINALMRYMRDEKSISIKGSKEKKQLMNIGYFHGYKGYRFVHEPKQELEYNNFAELMAVYEFDMNLKAIVYPYIMFIETSLKSHAIETCIELCSSDFLEVYDKLLDKYKKYPINSEKYKRTLKANHNFRNIAFTCISERYIRECQSQGEKNKMITHYQNKGKQIPLWAILEILTLGQFGILVQTMNDKTSIKLADNLNVFYSNTDENGRLVETLVFFFRDLRNAVAHNSIIFDCRFMESNPPKKIKRFVMEETGIQANFKHFDDFIVLLVVFLLKLEYTQKEMKHMISGYVNNTERLRKKVPIEIYNKILGTQTNKKMSILLNL